MDVRFELHEILFVWNKQKAAINKQKHGISFQEAAEAFFDPFLKVVDAGEDDEERNAVIGMDVQWKVLFVVHIQIENDAIRIISARKATRTERQNYED